MEDIESSVQEDYSSRVIIGQDTRTQVFLAWNVASSDGRQVFMHRNENRDEHYWVLEPGANNRYIISNYRNRKK